MPRQSKQPVVLVANAPRKKKVARRKNAGGAMVVSAPGRLRGHGDYTYDKPGPWGKAGRWLGEAMGSHFAGKGGGKLGEKIGSYLHYIGKIFGSGDYVTSAQQVKSNTLVNSSQVPQFTHGKHTMRIQHREFLGDIYSSATAGAFNLQDFPINPGQLASFPWLANVVGVNYQQYRINGMVFEFRSMSADALNSTNTALGSVVMATDYDSTDQRFTSKAQMENTEFGVSCKPSSCMIHAIECARNQTAINELYMRPSAVPSGADIRLYDLGRFSIATVGLQAASVNLGELWVSYDIEFLKPIQQAPLANAPMAGYTLVTVTSSNPVGTSVSSDYSPGNPSLGQFPDQIGLSFTPSSVQLPSSIAIGSVFNLTYWVSGSSTASVAPPVVTYTHGLAAVGNKIVLPGTSTTSTFQTYCEVFVYNGGASPSAPPTIDFMTGLTVPTAATGGINIYQISPLMAGNTLY